MIRSATKIVQTEHHGVIIIEKNITNCTITDEIDGYNLRFGISGAYNASVTEKLISISRSSVQ